MLAKNDGRLKGRCKRHFGNEVLVAQGTVDLLEQINAFVPARDELFEETQETLAAAVKDGSSVIGAAPETFDTGFRIHNIDSVDRKPDTPFRDLARIGRIDIVELHDLRVASKDGAERVGLADVRIFASIHMTELQLQLTSTGSTEWVTTYDGELTHGFVDLTVAVAWDKNWKVQSVSPTGPAVIVLDTSEYDDLEDVPPFHSGDNTRGQDA